MKKLISYILILTMIISCISVVSVNAADYNAKITLNGKSYTYLKGTNVTYTCKLTTTAKVQNGQYEFAYPSSLLKITKVDFPVTGNSTVYNYTQNIKDMMKFNFSCASVNENDIYDFTSSATNNTLFTVTFKVIGNGSGKIALSNEILSDYNDNDINASAKYTESISKTNYKNPELSATKKTIYVKKSTNLKVNYGSSSSVKWTSSNTKVATVSSSGKVVGKKAGTATITATKDGKKLTCKITVKNPTVKAKKSSIKIKKTTTITIKNAVGTTKYKTLTKKIAKVNSKGKVTGLKKGTAKIQVTASGVKFVIKIKVK